LLKLGLTGGIASGKSVVGEMFVKLGAHLTEPMPSRIGSWSPAAPSIEEVVQRFGREILNPDGSINRPPGRSRVRRPRRRATARQGTQRNCSSRGDRTRKRMDGRNQPRDPKAIAIVEAALILEAGAASRFDRLIVVTCHPEQRILRFARRLGISEDAARAEVTRRMAAQIPDEEKIKAADFVIDNSGSLEATEQQVQGVFAALREAPPYN
jgi:dephospho-CoA kinase